MPHYSANTSFSCLAFQITKLMGVFWWLFLKRQHKLSSLLWSWISLTSYLNLPSNSLCNHKKIQLKDILVSVGTQMKMILLVLVCEKGYQNNPGFLTYGLCSCGAGYGKVLCEVDVAHITSTAAEVVRAILHLWREVCHHTAIIVAALVVSRVSPTPWQRERERNRESMWLCSFCRDEIL